MKKTVYSLLICLVCLIGLIILPGYTSSYLYAIDLLPRSLQRHYIDYVFSTKESIFNTYYEKVGLLRVLRTNHNLNFDPNVLIPLCKDGENELREPIPAGATYLIASKYPEIIPALLEYYQTDVGTTFQINFKIKQAKELAE